MCWGYVISIKTMDVAIDLSEKSFTLEPPRPARTSYAVRWETQCGVGSTMIRAQTVRPCSRNGMDAHAGRRRLRARESSRSHWGEKLRRLLQNLAILERSSTPDESAIMPRGSEFLPSERRGQRLRSGRKRTPLVLSLSITRGTYSPGSSCRNFLNFSD